MEATKFWSRAPRIEGPLFSPDTWVPHLFFFPLSPATQRRLLSLARSAPRAPAAAATIQPRRSRRSPPAAGRLPAMTGSAPLGDGRPAWGTDGDGPSRTKPPPRLDGAPLPRGISSDGRPPRPAASNRFNTERRRALPPGRVLQVGASNRFAAYVAVVGAPDGAEQRSFRRHQDPSRSGVQLEDFREAPLGSSLRWRRRRHPDKSSSETIEKFQYLRF